MKDIRKVLLGLVIGIIVGAGGLLYFATHYDRNPSGKVSQIETSTIEYGLQDIGELATETYNFTKVSVYDSAKQFNGINIPFTKSKVIFSYDGTIKAGIEFSEITLEVDHENKKVTVSLPKAKILSSELDHDSFKLYDEKNSIFNPISVRDVNDTQNTLLTDARDEAVAAGLLERADRNARIIVENFIAGYLEDYEIAFK